MFYSSYIFLLVATAIGLCAGKKRWVDEEWDAIVVGAGPAGIIVSSRLSERGLKTLLLELGELSYAATGGDLDDRRPAWLDNTDLTRVDVPGLYSSIFGDGGGMICGPDVVAAYAGCTIGGGSAINAGLFFEPPASDWDRYFPDGWKSADMKGALERLYDTQPSTNLPSQDGKYYLQSGYTAARKWLVDLLGYEEVPINSEADEKHNVFGHPEYQFWNGQRSGPAVTYLQDALKRPNFRLQDAIRVLRVERDGDHATGVTALVDGAEEFIALTPTGKVIASEGAILSPALLMFSGIGPQDTLSQLYSAGKLSHNISPNDFIVNPSVGENLFDNPNTFIILEGPDIEAYHYSYDNPIPADRDLYLNHRSGPYSFAGQTSVFWSSITHSDGSVAGLQGTIGVSGFRAYDTNHTITLNVYGTSGLLSRGRVVLDPTRNFIAGASGDVYYSHERDAFDISTFIYDIFQKLPEAGLSPMNIPQDFTREQIETYITTWSDYARGQVNHWSSSCKIGECVDVDTKVIGMQNLFVVDGSIVEPLTVNPMFGIMAAAERASERILALKNDDISGGAAWDELK